MDDNKFERKAENEEINYWLESSGILEEIPNLLRTSGYTELVIRYFVPVIARCSNPLDCASFATASPM